MKRVILLVIDSLGVGEMDDVARVRVEDKGSNTLKHVSEFNRDFNIENLESIGAGYLVESTAIKRVKDFKGSFGKSLLQHYGADTYLGHQEIMGSRPKMPIFKPFSFYIDKVEKKLKQAGHKVERPDSPGTFLLVDGLVTVADNVETDPGQNINVTAPLDFISFEEEMKIGSIVRENVEVSRVIVLGGREISIEDILNAVEVKEGGITGINCPKSGVYRSGYMVRHLGYGIEPDEQVTTILKKSGYDVTLIGKAADVIECTGAEYLPMVETDRVMETVLLKMHSQEGGLIVANVQETDLSGHQQNVALYGEKLMLADRYVRKIMDIMEKEDILIVTGDHGNDPTIGHSRHTREKTLLLVYGKNLRRVNLGERSTLSDIASTIADYFNIDMPQNGKSFLKMLT